MSLSAHSLISVSQVSPLFTARSITVQLSCLLRPTIWLMSSIVTAGFFSFANSSRYFIYTNSLSTMTPSISKRTARIGRVIFIYCSSPVTFHKSDFPIRKLRIKQFRLWSCFFQMSALFSFPEQFFNRLSPTHDYLQNPPPAVPCRYMAQKRKRRPTIKPPIFYRISLYFAISPRIFR